MVRAVRASRRNKPSCTMRDRLLTFRARRIMQSGSFPDVPGRAHRKDALVAADEQHPFQKPATLIVKKIFIPFVFHELGYDHDDGAIRILFRKIKDELDDRNDD